jgi:S1-C subfamily serine protease
MITANVFRRTFFIQHDGSQGTAFTIDVDKRQYLVTARHVCASIKDGDNIGIFRNGSWQEKKTKVVGVGLPDRIDTDVAVLALEEQLSPSFPLPPTGQGLIWGQNVYFLGYPYGLHTSVDVNDGYPLALVKGAVMSGSVGQPGNPETFLLDGHNNKGFSGGPVVFQLNGGEFKVMAIVSAYKTEAVEIKFQGKPTGLASDANTGIIVCPSIKQVVDMISAKPIGPAVVR